MIARTCTCSLLGINVQHGLVFPNFFNYLMPDIADPDFIDSVVGVRDDKEL